MLLREKKEFIAWNISDELLRYALKSFSSLCILQQTGSMEKDLDFDLLFKLQSAPPYPPETWKIVKHT